MSPNATSLLASLNGAPLFWASSSLLVGFLAWACVGDLKHRRISNLNWIVALCCGNLLQAVLPPGAGLFSLGDPGGLGLAAALGAAVLAFVATFILWRLNVFGAGDAKLLIGIAPWFGPAGVPPLLLLTLASGGLLALGTWTASAADGNRVTSRSRIAYSPAIAAGAVLAAVVLSQQWWPR